MDAFLYEKTTSQYVSINKNCLLLKSFVLANNAWQIHDFGCTYRRAVVFPGISAIYVHTYMYTYTVLYTHVCTVQDMNSYVRVCIVQDM